MSAEHFRRPARRSILLVPIAILSLAVTPRATADSGADAAFTGDEWETGRFEVSFERDFSIDSFRPEVTVSFGRDVTERLAFETEIILWDSSLSYVPPHESIDTHLSKVQEEDFGEVNAKLEWRWSEEAQLRPEIYGFFEASIPFYRGDLSSHDDLETALGLGFVKNYGWGQIDAEVAFVFDQDNPGSYVGEYDIEVTKRVSSRTNFVTSLEGGDNELSLNAGPQWLLGKGVIVQLQAGVAKEEEDSEFAPEIRVMFAY